MKHLFILLLIPTCLIGQVKIEPTIMGMGYWTSNHNVIDPTAPTSVPRWTDVKDSGVRLVRVGGIAYNNVSTPPDNKPISPLRYVALVDEIRKNGCEPVITIPFVYDPGSSQVFQTQINLAVDNAKEIIRLVNQVHKRNIRYVILGNKPGIEYGFDQETDAPRIAEYVKALAIAVKDVDPSIKTIGPEQESYNKKIYDQLFPTTGTTPSDISGLIVSSGPSNNKAIIDFISVHQYINDFQTLIIPN